MVKDEDAGTGHFGGGGDLFDFAAADERGRVGSVAALQNFADDDGSGALGELAKFGEGLLRVERNGVVFGVETQGLGGRAGLQGLGRNARRLSSGVVGRFRLAVRARVGAGTELDSDQECAFRFSG